MRMAAALVLAFAPVWQDNPTQGPPASQAESQPGVKPPHIELSELNAAIRQGLAKGKGKEADIARAAQFREGQRQLSEFIKKYDGKMESLSARVMRATLSLAIGERGEAALDLEPVVAALADTHSGPQLALRMEALRWYCEADPAKARPLVEALAAGTPAEKSKAASLLLKVDAVTRLREGNDLLPFTATAIDGSAVSNTSYPGKVVLIHFWRSGSADSIDELRALKSLYRAKHRDGFEILGVSLDDKRIRTVPGGEEPAGDGVEGLRRFVGEFGVPWAQVYDGGGMDSKLAQTFNVGNLPANILVDRKGKIRALSIPIEDLPDKVGKLLGER
jgi:hypothetical protein